LPSWEGWASLGDETTISRLLIIRETRTNRSVAAEFRRLLRTSYPSNAADALDALMDDEAWPGPALLWAAKDRKGGGYRLVARR
jgi:hypothetical protein